MRRPGRGSEVAMIREKHLDYWTKVTRMIRGQIVQTTCCCPAPGEGRRDCMMAKHCKTPCACACHGMKLDNFGRRFRQLDRT